MHITTIDAISLDGKISKGDNQPSHTWTSDEDWRHFTKIRDSYDLIIMGRNTYEAVHPSPESERLRIVLTHHVNLYVKETAPGQLEFRSCTPKELVAECAARGYSKMLLVGGQVNTEFWAEGLVDEAFITIEPLLFGKGQQLADNPAIDARLRLLSVKKLNDQGTLALHYLVDK